MRGLDFIVGAFVADDGCQKPSIAEADRIIDRMPMLRVVSVFIVLLFSDFISGVVELEHDVLTQRQPWAGFGMFCQEVEVVFGVKLDALSFGGVLSVRIDPLISVLEKCAPVHEPGLLRVLTKTRRRRRPSRSRRSKSPQ